MGKESPEDSEGPSLLLQEPQTFKMAQELLKLHYAPLKLTPGIFYLRVMVNTKKREGLGGAHGVMDPRAFLWKVGVLGVNKRGKVGIIQKRGVRGVILLLACYQISQG